MSIQEKQLKERLLQQHNNEHFYLERLNLTHIPDEVFRLSDVRHLVLDGNAITSWPEDWGDLINLESLTMENNLLVEVGASISQLKQLKHLNLKRNRLTRVDEAIGDLEHLERINLDHNQLATVPERLFDSPHGQYLDLSWNLLTTLPQCDDSAFTHVDCRFNNVTQVPTHVPQNVSSTPNPFFEITNRLEAHTQLQQSAPFCVTGAKHNVLDAIKIRDVTTLQFPLKAQAQEDLLGHASRAPFGRGEDTVFDDTVRKTWQIDPADIEIQSPTWSQTLDDILDEVARGFGMVGQPQASLYKMLVYEPGDFFVPHRDTEKEDGMFATLVIVLPVPFGGGQLVVQHEGQSVYCALNHMSDQGISYAAFYTDCVHELRRVESGHRMALVYNICHTAQTRGGETISPMQMAKTKETIKQWEALYTAGFPIQKTIALPLAHQYTRAELELNKLKGEDWRCAQLIDQAVQDNEQVECALARVTVYDEGYVRYSNQHDTPIFSSERKTCLLKEWRRLDGVCLSKEDQNIAFQTCLPWSAADKLTLNDEQIEYTGNEGTNYERFYETWAIVLTMKHDHVRRREPEHYHTYSMSRDFERMKSVPALKNARRLKQTKLSLAAQRIEELAHNTHPGTQLLELDLSGNTIYNYPAWMASLTQLTALNLSGCTGDNFHFLGHLKNLRILNLDQNYLNMNMANLFNTLASLPHLEVLSFNFPINTLEIPNEILGLTALKHLSLNSALRDNMPAVLRKMTWLTTLTLGNNNLPPEAFQGWHATLNLNSAHMRPPETQLALERRAAEQDEYEQMYGQQIPFTHNGDPGFDDDDIPF